MIETTFYGRGGEGIISAAKILAEIIFKDYCENDKNLNFHAQSLSEFGPERRGAPIRAFTRWNCDSSVLPMGQVREPNNLIVFNPSVIENLVIADLKNNDKDGFILVNYFDSAISFSDFVGAVFSKEIRKGKKIYSLPARFLKQELEVLSINTFMLAGISRILSIGSVEVLKSVMEQNRFDFSSDMESAVSRILSCSINEIKENIFSFEIGALINS